MKLPAAVIWAAGYAIGEIIDFGISTKYIRGVNFQPAAFFGRHPKINRGKAWKAAAGRADTHQAGPVPEADLQRMTLSGVLNRIEKQTSGMIRKNDFIPLPCNVERVAITYLYKSKGGFVPITRNVKIKDYLPIINNTFVFTIEDMLKEAGNGLLHFENACECLKFLKDFKNIVPVNFGLKPKEERIEYVNDNTFRISVSSFVDAYNFDMKSMQKECVHIITPDLRRIPFSAYNMIYRVGSGWYK